MTDTRNCEQCGTEFAPRREHGRFCSARCRVAWNRENLSDPTAEVSALSWSVTAMRDVTARLARARAWDRPRAFALVSEAVWWVTIVDATLVRHHPDLYDSLLAERVPAERARIEGTLAGLRFVRNRMGHDVDHVDFIEPAADCGGPGEGGAGGGGRVTSWIWRPVPKPTRTSLSPRGLAWEMARFGEYETQLVGNAIGETFGPVTTFLRHTAQEATSDLAAIVAIT